MNYQHVLIDGTRYRILETAAGGFRERIEPAVTRQPGIAGSSFKGATDPHPDLISWKIDNWSGGEGLKVFDSTDPELWDRYDTSTAPVDVRTPGKISLGEDVAVSLASTAATTAGPHLVSAYNPGLAADTVWVFYDTAAQERTTSPDTWTSRTLTGATNGVTGPPDVYAQTIFYGENRGAGSRLRRYTPANGNPTVTVVNAQGATSPIVTNNRAFYIKASGLVYNNPTDTTTAGTTAYTNLGITNETSFSNLTYVGSNVFWIYREPGDDHRLFVYDGSVGKERMRLPKGFITGNGAGSGPYEWITALNDVTFVGGYFAGTSIDTPALGYLTADSFIGIDHIREGTSDRISTLAATQRNEVLVGMNSGKIFRYDMATGGISLFADLGSTVSLPGSILYSTSGHYYYATRNSGSPMDNIRVYRSTPGVYVATSTINEPIWNFDLPGEEKILVDLELHFETLTAGTSITVTLTPDGNTGNDITTDANGNTLSASFAADGAISRKRFVLDDKVRYVQPKITLATSTTTNRPVLLSATLRATAVNFIKYYEFTVAIDDETDDQRVGNRQASGQFQADKLRTLRDNKSVFSFTPFYASRVDRPAGTAEKALVKSMDLSLSDQGGRTTGAAQIVLRVVA